MALNSRTSPAQTAIKNLACLGRTSDEEQKRGENIKRQIDSADNFLGRPGVLIENGGRYKFVPQIAGSTDPMEKYFFDDGYNLETIDPDKAIWKLLERCRRGEFQAIYVDHYDRPFRSRSNEIRGKILDILEQNDVELITASGPLPAGLAMQMSAVMGAEEKKGLIRKLHNGKKARAIHQRRPPSGHVPFGLSFDKETNQWATVDPEAQAILWGVDLAAGIKTDDMPPTMQLPVDENPQGLSDSQVERTLMDHGINLIEFYKRNKLRKFLQKNPTGRLPKGWFSGIMREDRYTGSMTFHFIPTEYLGKPQYKHIKKDMKEKYEIKVPAIVTKEKWLAAQEARRRRSCYSARHVRQEYLLEKILKCSGCGMKMGARAGHKTYENRKTGKISHIIPKYYTCKTKSTPNRPACPAKCHNAKILDPMIFEKVREFINRPDIAKSIADAMKTPPTTDPIHVMRLDLERQQGKLADLEDERTRVATFMAKRVYTEQDGVQQLERITVETREVEKKKRDIQAAIDRMQRAEAAAVRIDIEKIRAEYGTRLKNLSFKERQQVMRMVVKEIFISHTGDINVVFFDCL